MLILMHDFMGFAEILTNLTAPSAYCVQMLDDEEDFEKLQKVASISKALTE